MSEFQFGQVFMPDPLSLPPPSDPSTSSLPALVSPPSIVPMKEDLSWEEEATQELLGLIEGRHPSESVRIRAYFGKSLPLLLDRLIQSFPLQKLIGRMEELKAHEQAILAFEKSLAPLRVEIDSVLTQRMPVVQKHKRLVGEISEMKGLLGNLSLSQPVAAWLTQKYGTNPTTIQTRMNSALSEIKNSVEPELIRLQTQETALSQEIGLRATQFYATHPQPSDLIAHYKSLILDYARLAPEAVMRLWHALLEEDAKKADLEISLMGKREEEAVQKEKEDFKIFFSRKSDEFLARDQFDERLAFAKWEVAWRTYFLILGREILEEEQARLASKTEGLKSEAEGIKNISVLKMMEPGVEDRLKKQAFLLQEKGTRIQKESEIFNQKVTLFQLKAQAIKEELSRRVDEYERLRRLYDERLAEVKEPTFTDRLLEEFKDYRKFKEVYFGVQEFYWQARWEDKSPTRIAGDWTFLHPELDLLIRFLSQPSEHFLSSSGIPDQWPERELTGMVIATQETAWVQEKITERLERSKREIAKRMEFTPRVRGREVHTLLELYLTPQDFKKAVIAEAIARGFIPHKPRALNLKVMDVRLRLIERTRRMNVISDRLEENLLLLGGIRLPDIQAWSISRQEEERRRSERYLLQTSPKIKELHLQMKAVRSSLFTGRASDAEKIAYVKAMEIVRTYAYHTALVHRLSENLKLLSEGVTA